MIQYCSQDSIMFQTAWSIHTFVGDEYSIFLLEDGFPARFCTLWGSPGGRTKGSGALLGSGPLKTLDCLKHSLFLFSPSWAPHTVCGCWKIHKLKIHKPQEWIEESTILQNLFSLYARTCHLLPCTHPVDKVTAIYKLGHKHNSNRTPLHLSY